jgi:hypothetical protein
MRNKTCLRGWRCVRGGFGRARPNPACDDGFKGPLSKPQAVGSRRTTLEAKHGLQRAAHLDLLPLLLVRRLGQLGHLMQIAVRGVRFFARTPAERGLGSGAPH